MSSISTRTIRIGRNSPQLLREILLICFLGMFFLFGNSCRPDFHPKPIAYPRLSYPQTIYKKTKNLPYPIAFEYPAFARLEMPSDPGKNEQWINLHFDRFRATLFAGYFCASEKEIKDHLIENEAILEKEAPPYAHIRKQEFKSDDGTVTGYLYKISGNTACPVQFIMTDKQRQLFRGALYFSYIPNPDSIKEILNGLTTNISNLMESFRFKQ